MATMPLWLLLLIAAAPCIAQAEWQPFRMVTHFDRHVLAMDQKMLDSLKKSTQEVIDLFGKALKVRRAPGKLLLPRECVSATRYANTPDFLVCDGQCHSDNKCDTIDIPEQHLMPCVTCPNAQSIHSDAQGCVVDGKPATKASVEAAKKPTSGVEADFIMYYTVKQETCGELATAKVCRQAFDSRTIAARISLCNPDDWVDTVPATATLVHETLHALGMSKGLFRFFSKEDGTPYTKRDEKNNWISSPETVLTSPTKNTTRSWMSRHGTFSLDVTLLTTPKVVAEARAHFACPTMEGVELENEGGEGTALSHWESRHLHPDVISPHGKDLTRFTLALLEDSGWYKADYTQATELTWGRGLGCDFVEKSCGEWMKRKRDKGVMPHPYCDDYRIDHGCSYDRLDQGMCSLPRTLSPTELPKEYQYFWSVGDESQLPFLTTNSNGHDFMDNCPHMMPLAYRCTYTEQQGSTSNGIVYGEGYGPNSRCIDYDYYSNWTSDGVLYKFDRAFVNYGGCYNIDCSGGRVSIEFEGQWHTCSGEGMKIHVQTSHKGKSVKGTLVCPAYVEVCLGHPTYSTGSRMWIAALFILKFIGAILFGGLFAVDKCLPRANK